MKSAAVAALARTAAGLACLGCALGTKYSYGPGLGDWAKDAPQEHGLNAKQLTAAGDELAARLPDRYCFLVAKDGYLVHEQYQPGYGPADTYEGDSAMKTVNALMIGVAVTKGLIDVDKPLSEYGVKPRGNWGTHWDAVTAKDILAQESGQGRYAPGSKFTYDSDNYIMHLSYLLQKVTSSDPIQWATSNFAEALGLGAAWYAEDHIDDDGQIAEDGVQVNIGGGQMTTCRQLLRAGQLMLNKGKWYDEAGVAQQLVSEDYIEQMMEPAFPQNAVSYGYLTWLNQPATADVQCCGANWCSRKGSAGQHLDEASTMTDDNKEQPIQAPYNTAFALGYLAKYMLVFPDQNTTVVTVGNTWGSSAGCDASQGGGNYGEQYSLANAWHAMAPALNLCGTMPEECKKAEPPAHCASYDPCATDPSVSHIPTLRDGDAHTAPVATPTPAHSLPRFQGGGLLNAEVEAADSDTQAGNKGSCSCYCPPGQGFGQCFPAASSADCDKASLPATMCPAIGVTKQCLPAVPAPSSSDGSADGGEGGGGTAAPTNWWDRFTQGRRALFSSASSNANKNDNGCDNIQVGFSGFSFGKSSTWSCTQTDSCDQERKDPDGSYADFQVATCTCKAKQFDSCTYSADPCPDSPFWANTAMLPDDN